MTLTRKSARSGCLLSTPVGFPVDFVVHMQSAPVLKSPSLEVWESVQNCLRIGKGQLGVILNYMPLQASAHGLLGEFPEQRCS